MLIAFCPDVAKARGDRSDDHTYEVVHRFETNCDRVQLLDILYDFSHLLEFMTDVDRLEKSHETATSYRVTYSYKYLFYKSRLVFKKTKHEKESIIEFQLESNWDNVEFLPELVNVHGFWKVERGSAPDGWTVRYYQRSVFDDDIGFFYGKILKARTFKFLRSLERYIEERQCHS